MKFGEQRERLSKKPEVAAKSRSEMSRSARHDKGKEARVADNVRAFELRHSPATP